jgi:acyl carrier protein
MAQQDALQQELLDLIRPYVTQAELLDHVGPQTHLLRDLKINSAHLIDIVLDVEKAFDISIDDDAVAQMNTVGDALRIIGERRSA